MRTTDLPARHEVQHVDAVGGLAVGLARGAGELDAEVGEEGPALDRVFHAQETRVEVDRGGERTDGEKCGVAHGQEGRDGLVEESFVNVGGLLEDQDVASRALCRGDLRVCAFF